MDNNVFNKELISKIDNFINEKFPFIYDYEFDGIVLLCSGAIRSLIMGVPVKDLDFVLLTQKEGQIKDFVRKFKFKYVINTFGAYKLKYKNFNIDFFSVNDLLDAATYDMDMMFYDINKHMFINCGIMKAIESRKITEINNKKQPIYTDKVRLGKMSSFIKYVTNSNKMVKIKKNRLLWKYKMFVKKVKRKLNKILNGNFRKCFIFLKNCKVEFVGIIIIGILISLLSLIFPAILGLITSSLVKNNYNFIVILIFLLFVVKMLALGLQFVFTKLYLIINKKMVNNIRKMIIDHVLNLEINNFNNNNRGVFIEKLKNDPNEITRIFNSIKDSLVRGFGNFGLIIYICFLDFRIGLLIGIFSIIIFYIIMIGIKKREIYMKEYYLKQEKYSSILGEMVNGVGEIKKLNLKDNYKKQAVFSSAEISSSQFNGNYCQRVYLRIASVIENVAVALVLLLGLYLFKNNSLDISSFIIIIMYNSTVFTFVSRMGFLANYFSELNVSCDRIFSLLDGNIYETENFGNIYKDKCLGKIEFRNVRFRYNVENDYVLNNCCFKVMSNEYVVLVGKSGSGKSTILNLISRLYSLDDGDILIDGVPINEYDEKFIRANISVISQNPYLFDMSIKDNIRLVKDNITDKEIKDVCKMVCLDEFIENLPNGYDTVIGEGGVKLSGGQKQRLAIARALIKNTKIILLDEITSALDNETSTIIKKVINNIKKKHTVILVTHELSMVKEDDRILVLDNGKIVGDGSHEELLEKNKLYKKLYKIK